MDELVNLSEAIDDIDALGDSFWSSSLEDRKKKEIEHADRRYDVEHQKMVEAQDTFEKFYGNKKYYKVTQRSSSYVDNWIRTESKDKIFLDFCCGQGENARKAAHAGASLSLGVDISSQGIKVARQISNDEDLNNIRFFQADAENTKLPDNSIDSIICSGVLHHLDMSYALPELRRILKPGGKILAVEALDYNPLIKLYRLLTPEMRTEWEKAHILSLKDVKFSQRFFELGHLNFWHVTAYVGGKFPFLATPLDYLDQLLEKIPLVRLMGWMFTFELIKPNEK